LRSFGPLRDLLAPPPRLDWIAMQEIEGEVIYEENGDAAEPQSADRLPLRYEAPVPALREVRTAAIAAAGGALAGVATVAAVRAVSASTGRRRPQRRFGRERPANVVASRSFLVDVHVLGR
jgi:hypothetical protein